MPTGQSEIAWVAWFEEDENGLITQAGVDSDNSAKQYNICVTTCLDDSDAPLPSFSVENSDVYNRCVIQDTNLIAAAPKLRRSLEMLLNSVRRTDEGDGSAWPDREAAIQQATALLASLNSQ